ncbi:MAG: gamma-carboxygeranoyl-CoA hydratase [Alphaproteobacteria bacterium CG_4_9_14_3_um_filter_47_13]|nr:MAG: gamma-carboxygeranoyl-CoA hydratase [Alphaproteobacteria bacterium CG_4_9_14_3_um_filter_47_13]
MTEDIILLTFEEQGVARVRLNRPDVHNAFDEHMIARLAEIWDELAVRDDVIAVVIEGKGKSFSAGADLNWMKRAADYTLEQNEADARALATMLHKFYTLPKLTVALVFGAAMGGGLGLVSCADIVIADENAKFALSEVRIGLIPATISPYVIRAMGARHAKRYFQTGERIDARKAYEIGLVHEIAHRPEDVEYMLHRLLLDLRANGPVAMGQAKALFCDVVAAPLDQTLLDKTSARIAAIRATPEAREGLSAFLEKRKAEWAKE